MQGDNKKLSQVSREARRRRRQISKIKAQFEANVIMFFSQSIPMKTIKIF